MESEPLKIKPHHLEGVQRYIKYGKETTREMYELLGNALAENPDAEMIFVRGVDNICRGCISGGYGSEHCATSDDIVNMDEEVARENGWEFDKAYKVQVLLDELKAEAPNREEFYFCKLTREEYERWLADVRKNKNR